MHATIWAPPNQFFVETPSTLAVDLGCAYTLTVDDEGAGLVSVLVGWVGFKWRDRESFIPAGSACATRPRIGPGTPYNERVSPAYPRSARDHRLHAGSPEMSNALTLVLDESTERDEVTLWHLLSRVPRRRSRSRVRSARGLRRAAGRRHARGHPRGRQDRCSTRGGTRSVSDRRRCGGRGVSSGRTTQIGGQSCERRLIASSLSH